jgi:pimeloyl-ACP methyl ester carboxylesterase
MEQALTFQDGAGHKVSAVLATPAQPTDRIVVLLHGFLSNKNSTTNKTLTRAFLEQGLATLRFDFFGQGESDGPFERITVTTALDQAQSAIALASAKGYRRIGLIGSSFGGLIALMAAAEEAGKGRLASLALKCPVPDFEEMLRLEFGPEGIVAWKQTGTIPNASRSTMRFTKSVRATGATTRPKPSRFPRSSSRAIRMNSCRSTRAGACWKPCAPPSAWTFSPARTMDSRRPRTFARWPAS